MDMSSKVTMVFKEVQTGMMLMRARKEAESLKSL